MAAFHSPFHTRGLSHLGLGTGEVAPQCLGLDLQQIRARTSDLTSLLLVLSFRQPILDSPVFLQTSGTQTHKYKISISRVGGRVF